MRVTIPDDVIATYEQYAAEQGRTIDEVVTAQLRRFSKLVPGKRAVIVQADALTDLEGRLGQLPLRDGQDLVDRVRRHAALTFEGRDLQLTPNQKAELVHRAARRGVTVEALVDEIWASLTGQFFWNSGGGQAATPATKSA